MLHKGAFATKMHHNGIRSLRAGRLRTISVPLAVFRFAVVPAAVHRCIQRRTWLCTWVAAIRRPNA
jgi:hypothetical protein